MPTSTDDLIVHILRHREQFQALIAERTVEAPPPDHVPHLGPCLVWTGTRYQDGYGRTWLPGTGRDLGVHRLSFVLGNGFLPEATCHRCDRRECVRPEHLFGGSLADNCHDRHRKGRDARGLRSGRYTMPWTTARGTRNGRAQLRPEDVRAIRRFGRAHTFTRRRLAWLWSVSISQVDRILAGRHWRHVEG